MWGGQIGVGRSEGGRKRRKWESEGGRGGMKRGLERRQRKEGERRGRGREREGGGGRGYTAW